jgi:hypothetical protein
VRTLRGAAAALLVTALAAGAHLSAGGRAHPELLLAVLVGAWVVATALAFRRLTTGQLVGLLVLGQVAVHMLGATQTATGHDGTMLLAHVTGTAVSAWALRCGEDVLSNVADRLVLRFATPLTAALPVPGRVEMLADAWAPSRARRVHDAEERGPPVSAR